MSFSSAWTEGHISRFVSGLVLLVTAGCVGADPAAVGPNVLLITLDTTRADRLGCYGGPPLTPNIDRLSQRAVVFEQAIAQASVTPVSHASIFTGLDPYHHGLRVMHGLEQNRLADEQVTLAEVLSAEGYATAAVVSSFAVSTRFGLGQGFDTFDQSFLEEGAQHVSDTGVVNTGTVQRRAVEVTDRALRWLEGRSGSSPPFFLWAHYFDPHDPYLLPPGVDGDLPGDPRPRLRELYDLEVRYMDQHVGRLLDGLDERGLLDEMVVVIVSDHGEGLGDHGWWTHGLLYHEQIRVPMIVKLPGQTATRRVAPLVRTIDLLPTIVELIGIGLDRLGEIDGVTLGGVMDGTAGDPGLVAYSDSVNMLVYGLVQGVKDRKNDMLFSVVEGPWKYVQHLYRPQQSELFNLDEDPGETRNRLADSPETHRRMLDELRARSFMPRLESSPEWMSDEDRDRLRALGYVD